MNIRIKRLPLDEGSGPPKKLYVSTTDRGEGYMSKDLKPMSKKEAMEFHVKLHTPGGGHIFVKKKFSDLPDGDVFDMNVREDQVARALGLSGDFSFEKHSISSDVRKNWLWHWFGLEYHAFNSFIVQRNVRLFKFFMDKAWFQMCMEMKAAEKKVSEDPSKFYVRLSRSKPGAISITLKLPGKLEPRNVRTYPVGEDLEANLEGTYYKFSKENLVTVAKCWITTGSADEYLSILPEPPSSSYEPADYTPVHSTKPTEPAEYL